MKKSLLSLIAFSTLFLTSCDNTVMGKINFHFCGGTPVEGTATENNLTEKFSGVAGTAVDVDVPDLQRDGYVFLGWFENCTLDTTENICTSYSSKIDFSSPDLKKIPYTTEANAYAVFSKEIRITYNFNQSSYDSSMTDELYISDVGYKGKPIQLDTIPTNPANLVENYNFVTYEWYTDKECTQKYDSNAYPEKDITLYARWQVNPSVTFFASSDGNGTFEDGSNEFTTIEYGKDEKIDINAIPTPIRSTEAGPSLFEGWYIATLNDDGSYNFTDTQFTFGVNTVGSNNLYLYAKWSDQQFLNVVYPNETKQISVYENKTLKQSLALLEGKFDIPEIENMTFKDFYYEDENKEKHTFYQDSTVITKDITTIYANYINDPKVNLYLLVENPGAEASEEQITSAILKPDSYLFEFGKEGKLDFYDNNLWDAVLTSKGADYSSKYYVYEYKVAKLDEEGKPVVDEDGNVTYTAISDVAAYVGESDINIYVCVKPYISVTYNNETKLYKDENFLSYSYLKDLNAEDDGYWSYLVTFTDADNQEQKVVLNQYSPSLKLDDEVSLNYNVTINDKGSTLTVAPKQGQTGQTLTNRVVSNSSLYYVYQNVNSQLLEGNKEVLYYSYDGSTYNLISFPSTISADTTIYYEIITQ